MELNNMKAADNEQQQDDDDEKLIQLLRETSDYQDLQTGPPGCRNPQKSQDLFP